eukprot:272049_1
MHLVQGRQTILVQRVVKIDGRIRTDPNFPAGFQDVVTLEKTGENFRLVYDTKGRFVLQSVTSQEAKMKLCKIKALKTAPNRVPFAVTHDGRTLRMPNPNLKVNDTCVVDLETNKMTEFIRFKPGAMCMVTG